MIYVMKIRHVLWTSLRKHSIFSVMTFFFINSHSTNVILTHSLWQFRSSTWRLFIVTLIVEIMWLPLFVKLALTEEEPSCLLCSCPSITGVRVTVKDAEEVTSFQFRILAPSTIQMNIASSFGQRISSLFTW